MGWRRIVPPLPDHDGSTYSRTLDKVRLNTQLQDVWDVMKDGKCRTLYELEAHLGYPTQSISARLRDFRKPKWGAHTVHRRRVSGGIWEYWITPNPDVVMLPRVPSKRKASGF